MNFRPEILDLTNPKHLDYFNNLKIENKPVIHDHIEGQLIELLLCRNPSIKKPELLSKGLLEDHLTKFNNDVLYYGNWVYYSWSNTLIHILGEEEFIEVRTNRNKYKITEEEQEILRGKSVGIVGLSVGRAVATIIALERIAGEIRLADMDEIELSNLNRIQAPLTEMGLNKTIAAAREIAELDPYLKVICYKDGLNEENMMSFMTQPTKIDILVEECDEIAIKFLSRVICRHLQIPVVMETNDRCMIDIERFDLEENRPLFHKLKDNFDLNLIKSAKSIEDKIPYIMDMVGIPTTSKDLRVSMLEVTYSLRSWPQLSSSVAAGAGILTTYIKNILLKHVIPSKRLYFDFENFSINNKQPKTNKIFSKSTFPISNRKKTKPNPLTQVDQSRFQSIIKNAILSPSAGNNQPWNFYDNNPNLEIHVNELREKSFWDSQNLGMYISLGCCLKNISISAEHLGFKHKTLIKYAQESGFPIIQIHFKPTEVCENPLFKMINQRRTNRSMTESEVINETKLSRLLDIAQLFPNLDLEILTDKNQIQQHSSLMAEAERIRILHPKGHEDFMSEVRWDDIEMAERRTGIPLSSLELNAPDELAFKLIQDPEIVSKLCNLNLGTGIKDLISKSIIQSSGIGLIRIKHNSQSELFNVGRMLQHIWLTGTLEGISIQPFLSLPIMLRLSHDIKSNILSRNILTLNKTAKSFGLDNSLAIMFRLVNSPKQAPITPRLRYDEIVF